MKLKLKDKHFQSIFFGIFILYLLILIKIILLKDTSLSDLPKHLVPGYEGFRSLNLTPFQTFRNFISIGKNGAFLWGISNIAGNALVFLPFGYLLSLRFSKKQAGFKIMISAFLLSLTFECLQFIFYLGSADIDDVILNTFGAFLGIVCFRILSIIVRHQTHTLYKVSLILGMTAFLGASLVGYFEFGNRLGISYKEEVQGGEKIPKSPEDFSGYFLSGNDTHLTVTNSIDPSFHETQKIQIKEDTTIYHVTYKSNPLTPYKTQTIYKLYTPSQMKSIKKNTQISIWFQKTQKQTADVIVLGDPVTSGETGDQKMSFSNDNTQLTGYIISVKPDAQRFTLNKIDSYDTQDGASVSTSTKIYLPVSYQKNVEIKIRDVYGNGSSYKDRDGTIKDLKTDSFVSMKGRLKDQTFYADYIMISVFHAL